MRVMALDFGDKRIGVAISDELGITAQGKEVIKRTDLRNDLEIIKNYIKEYDISRVIVGWPKRMDGSEGERAEKTREFFNFLKKNLSIIVELWDERLSSAEAERVLLQADMSRQKRKDVIDKLAATLILDTYLRAQQKGANKHE